MFAWLELRTYCQATEDQVKVAKALAFVCPRAKLTAARTEGYYKNPILVMTARTDSSRAIEDFWMLMVRENLAGGIMESSGNMIDDDGIFHVRLGKQEAYEGRAVLASNDDAVIVRMKLARYSYRGRDPVEVLKEKIEEFSEGNVSHT